MTTETQKAPAAEQDQRGERTILTGKVTSAKMEKTIVVEVQRLGAASEISPRRAHFKEVLRP